MAQLAHYSDLKNTNVFITGGGSGIGAALVTAFIEQGANVGFVDIQEKISIQLCDQLEKQYQNRPLFIQCDVQDIPSLKSAIDFFVQQTGRIQTLVNNAANDERHQLNTITPERWQQLIDINLTPYVFSSQSVMTHMKDNKSGAIINIGSNASLLGLSGYPAYIAAKAGIVGLSKSMARELGPDKIRVNCVLPGWVMTEKQKSLHVTPEELNRCLEQQCIKETIQEQDIANTVLFLASQASKMITGQSIVVDGGRA